MMYDVLQMGDRVAPVGTGKATFSAGLSLGTSVNRGMVLDRREALVSKDA